ncbi:hypothetical protein CCP4SC76_5000007 [Gammaproteobacteria bacterium]
MSNNTQYLDTSSKWFPNLGSSEIKQLRSDCMTLALRLFGEDDDTFSLETYEVMSRWRPKCLALLNGETLPESSP